MYYLLDEQILAFNKSLVISILLMNTSIYLYQNYGAFYDKTGAGITGPVKLKGVKSGTTVDLSSQQWTYQVSVLISFSFLIFLKFNMSRYRLRKDRSA